MSLVRAFTKRNKRPDISLPSPTRASSLRNPRDGPINRSLISPPVELLSTTNVLAYDAPDLADLPDLLYSSSMVSSDDSDGTGFDFSRGGTPDNSSIDTPSPVEPNHLSSYFRVPGQQTSFRQSSGSSDADAPAIPTRAMSHTKKTHQIVARQRSISRMTPPPNALASPTTTRSSLDMFSSKPEANHPFGAELEQVNELAEEYCAREVAILDEEEEYLMNHGLCKFGVEDYVAEIEAMFGDVYEDRMAPVWI